MAIRAGPDTISIPGKLIEVMNYHPFGSQFFNFFRDVCDRPVMDSIRDGFKSRNELHMKGFASVQKTNGKGVVSR